MAGFEIKVRLHTCLCITDKQVILWFELSLFTQGIAKFTKKKSIFVIFTFRTPPRENQYTHGRCEAKYRHKWQQRDQYLLTKACCFTAVQLLGKQYFWSRAYSTWQLLIHGWCKTRIMACMHNPQSLNYCAQMQAYPSADHWAIGSCLICVWFTKSSYSVLENVKISCFMIQNNHL